MTTPTGRLHSLDQFRGYTVAGMFFVNFVGAYLLIPAIFKHHKTYCSYADTIMPQFFFAVGFAYRLTFLRRRERDGKRAAWGHAIRRSLALLLLGLIIYQLDGDYKSWAQLRETGLWGFLSTAFRRNYFQTLVHIGVTCLWILPVIGSRTRVMALFMVGSGLLHLALSRWFYFDWALANRVIDGGPLGFLSWTIPTLAGALTHDCLMARGPRRSLGPVLGWGAALMAGGYALTCLTPLGMRTAGLPAGEGWRAWLAAPPFFPPVHPVDIWTMSQQTGSISYLIFATGFSLGIYGLCVWLSDLRGLQWGFFRTLGQNALAGYILHGWVAEAVEPFTPRDAPVWYVLGACAVFIWLTWLILRYLERRQMFLRL